MLILFIGIWTVLYFLFKDTTIPSVDLRDMEKDQDENPQNWE